MHRIVQSVVFSSVILSSISFLAPQVLAIETANTTRPVMHVPEMNQDASNAGMHKNDLWIRPPTGTGEGKMRKARLAGQKLNYCTIASKRITNRSGHINEMVTNMGKRFDSIALGVENHYTATLAPAGKTIPNYNDLVASIQTQKDAITPLLAKIQTDISSFSCTADDPGGQLIQYRIDVLSVIQGLEVYKQSVRTLLLAVVNLQGNTSGSMKHTGSSSADLTNPSTETGGASPAAQ